MENATQKLLAELYAALSVIVLTKEIRHFLQEHDPKAWQQCNKARNAYLTRHK